MSETADRLAILDLLGLYARGIDRCDLATLNGVWATGATADYGQGPADAVSWSAATIAALAAMRRTQHFLGQAVITLDGDRASAESYCQAYHEVDGPDGPMEMVVGGRYLDDLVRTIDGWRIAKRRYVMDWNRNLPSSAQWDGPLYGGLARIGRRAPDDPLYTGD